MSKVFIVTKEGGLKLQGISKRYSFRQGEIVPEVIFSKDWPKENGHKFLKTLIDSKYIGIKSIDPKADEAKKKQVAELEEKADKFSQEAAEMARAGKPDKAEVLLKKAEAIGEEIKQIKG